MAAKVFQLMNGGIRYGKGLKTSTSGYYQGLMAKLDTSGSTVTTSGSAAATKPFGFLFGLRYREYRPASQTYDSGEEVVLVTGQGFAAMSVDFFDEAALPSTPGTAIYASQSGKWTTNVTANKVGTYVQTVKRTEPVGGTGALQSLAVVMFHFEP